MNCIITTSACLKKNSEFKDFPSMYVQRDDCCVTMCLYLKVFLEKAFKRPEYLRLHRVFKARK